MSYTRRRRHRAKQEDAFDDAFDSGLPDIVQRAFPVGASFFANFNGSVNGTAGLGDLTGTPVGGAKASAGRLDLGGETVKYVDYDAHLNADSQQVGTLRCDLSPNYAGTPDSRQVSCFILRDHSDPKNAMGFFHKEGDGTLRITALNSAGSIIFSSSLGVWAPVAGKFYSIELNWDITAGATRLFVNGTQFGSTVTSTGVRDGNINLLRLGSNDTALQTSDFKLDNVTVFPTVQHTENFIL